jgi:WD40 repeat protein
MSSAVEIFPIAIGEYDHWDPLDVDTVVDRLAELLADFGGQIHRPWTVPMADRGRDAIDARLAEWQEDDAGATVLYWVGHGWSDTMTAKLAHARSLRHLGVEPATLADAIVRWESKARADAWLLVVIDGCRSARYAELLAAAVDDRGDRRRVIVLGTSGDASTALGRFTAELDVALRHTFADNQEIVIAQLVDEVQRRVRGERRILNLGGDAVLRRIAPIAAGYSGPLDARMQLNEVIRDLPDDERRHFLTKAQGGELKTDGDVLGELTWHFIGRAEERRAVVSRLGSDGMVVVTGRAGSGKSALLGDILVRSRRALATVLLDHGLLAPAAHEQPPPFDSAVHLTGLSAGQLISRVCADLELGDVGMDQPLASQLDELEQLVWSKQERSQILVDALDEAVEPSQVAAVLRRLSAIPGVCLVVGTRSSTLEGPDQPSPDDTDLLDALGTSPERTVVIERDLDAAFDYVRRRLNTLAITKRVTRAEVEAAARAVAAVDQEFLYTRLVTYELLARPDLVKADDLVERVGVNHRAVFAAAVDRLSRDNPAFQPLLQALAVAQGRGTPIRDGVWAALASAIAGDAASDGAIYEVIDSAAPYLAVDHEHGQTVYRLAHRTFAEHLIGDSELIRGWHDGIVQRAILELEGANNNPYWIHHVSAHCAAGGLDAWNLLAQSDAIDMLDPVAVGSDAMRSLFARGPMPVNVGAVIASGHQLRTTPKSERVVIRQLAAARLNGALVTKTTHPEAACDLSWAAVARRPLHAILAGHGSPVWAVAAVPLPDGRVLLASGGGDGSVRLWDPATGAPVGNPLTGHSRGVSALAALPLPDGRMLLASGGDDGSVRLWDPATGAPVGRLTGHTGGAWAVAALPLPDGRVLLASGGSDGSVRLWDPVTGAALGDPLTGHIGAVRAVAALPLPDSRVRLASIDGDGSVWLWDPVTGALVCRLTGHTGNAWAVAAVPLPDGRVRLASGGADGSVRLWDPVTGAPVGDPLTGHTGWVWAVAAVALPDGEVRLASGGNDGSVRLWDPVASAPVGNPLTGHTGAVRAVAAVALPGGRMLLASSGADGSVWLWDPATGGLIGDPLAGHTGGVSAVAAVPLPDGQVRLASGSDDGSVQLWNSVTGAPVGDPLTGHTGAVRAVAAVPLPDGQVQLASCSDDGSVQLWNPVTGAPVGDPLTRHAGAVRAVAAVPLPDGQVRLASGGDDGSVQLWNPVIGAPVGRFTGHTGAVRAVVAVPLPDGQVQLASGSDDASVRLWDLTGASVRRFTGHTGAVRAVVAVPLPDGQVQLASGGNDRSVRLWHRVTGACVLRIPMNADVRSLSSLGSVRLAVAMADGVAVIKIRDQL